MSNIKSGAESLIGNHINDKFRVVLSDIYNNLVNIGKKYYIKKSITKNEYDKEFDKVVKHFEKETIDRFNIKISLRNSKTFAVMPLYNTESFGSFNFGKNKDAKNAVRQLKEFNKYLESNIININLKDVTIENLPNDFYFPLFIDVKTIVTDIEEDEFGAIVTHEIGHIFTLLEMYSSSVKSTSSILNSLLKNDTLDKTLENLNITTNDNLSDSEKSVMIYKHITKEIRDINLASGRENDRTDTEYNADNFAVKFGYGDALLKALNKTSETRDITFDYLFSIGIFKIICSMLISVLVRLFITNTFTFLSLTLFFIFLDVLNNLTNLTVNKRNPNGDSHGDLKTRANRIRTSIISLLRTNNLNRDDLKLIVKQLDIADREIDILDKSLIDSVFGSIVHKSLSVNLNIQDSLASSVDSLINNNLYVSSAKFQDGIESASYKGKKHPVVDKLNNVFKNITDKNLIVVIKDYTEYINELEDIIYEEFGIPVNIMPGYLLGGSWGCIPFNFIEESALSNYVTYMNKSRFTISNLINMDANAKLVKQIKKNDIIVDKINNKVIGLDKHKNKTLLLVEFGRDDLGGTHKVSNLALKPEEMTGVILHEIGHLFTYLDAMTRNVKTNSLLQESFLDATDNSKISKITYDERIEKADKNYSTLSGNVTGTIITYLNNFILSMQSLAGLNNGGSPISIMISRGVNKNTLGDSQTYVTDSEALADNFAAMYGVGAEVTTGLKRILTLNLHSKFFIMMPLLYYTFINTVKTLLVIGDLGKVGGALIIGIIKMIVGIVSMWFVYFIAKLILNDDFPYEKLPDRFDGIKRGILKVVREEKINKIEKKRILESLEIIDNNIAEVIDGGYGSIIMSMFVPSKNIGITLKPAKELTDILDKLINNDMYQSALKFDVGLEATKHFLKDVTVFYTESVINYGTPNFISKWLTKPNVKNINKILSKYNISIEFHNGKLGVKSSTHYNIKTGISGFALVPVEDNGVDNVISMTMETDKISWHLANPYINVYNIDTVQLSDLKYLYIEEMDNLPIIGDGKHKKADKLGKKISDSINNFYYDYGTTTNVKEIDEILKIKELTKELKEQFLILKSMIIENEKTDNSELDLHAGNISEKDGIFILLDPVYNSNRLGFKQSNYIKIVSSRLAPKTNG